MRYIHRILTSVLLLVVVTGLSAQAQIFRVENRAASPAERRDLLATIETLSTQNGVQTATLVSIAEAIGVEFPDLGFEELTSRVTELAGDAADLRRNLENLETELASLRETAEVLDARTALAEAQAMFDQGDLASAEAAFLPIAQESLARQDESRRAWLDAVDAQATIARLRQDFRSEAAIRRAARLQLTDIRRALDHEILLQVIGEAEALYTFGDMKGDNTALIKAIELYKNDALPLAPRQTVPLQWAMTQMNLGNALLTLGEMESGTARFEDAVTAYQNALEELTRDRVPLQWAMTQMNLGSALSTLAERESGTARLEQAVTAYQNALEERTRDRVPLQWAMTQMNLGTALQAIGERESGTTRLEQAVTAYQNALEERTRDRVPLDWAMTQMNLGNALLTLGKRESGTARLEQAVTAYQNALEELTRDRVPLQWATTQMNLGGALSTLAVTESGTTRLEQAVTAYQNALEELTRDRVPLQWAMTQGNLAAVYYTLADKGENPAANLRQAIDLTDAALEVYAAAGADYYIDLFRQNRAIFQTKLDALDGGD